jgi:hypothetical protein
MDNYIPLVISGNDKNKQLTLLSQHIYSRCQRDAEEVAQRTSVEEEAGLRSPSPPLKSEIGDERDKSFVTHKLPAINYYDDLARFPYSFFFYSFLVYFFGGLELLAILSPMSPILYF